MINKHKIVQVKQWLKEKTCKDGKLDFKKTFVFTFAFLEVVQLFLWFLEKFCMICGFIISTFVEIAPFLQAFFKFLENLASTLSYKKKEFFCGFL